MAKVSIGLRGWRFEEDDIFDDDGALKPLEEIPEDPRERLVRLTGLIEEPCDACYLNHGDEKIHRCHQAEIVYGEPGGELLLCGEHEPDFLYWFREEDGSAFKGEREFADRFHEWYAAGGEAPDGYASIEHVEEDPDALPEPPDQEEIQRRLDEEFDGERIDVRALSGDEAPDEDELLSDEDLAEADVDLSTEYPSGSNSGP